MATEVQLTRLSDVGPGEVSTALWGHRGAAASKFLSAEQLTVLGAGAAGSAARRPLTGLPAVGWVGQRGEWVERCGGARLGPSEEKRHISHLESAVLAGNEAASVPLQSKGCQPF